jgi:hypothetical protein
VLVRSPRGVRRVGAVAAAAAAAIGLVLFEPRPYATAEPEVIGWLEANLPSVSRIGLAGVWDPGAVAPVLPAYGARLDNRVEYQGRFVRGTMQAWMEREPFDRQLRERRYDAVVVGRGVPPRPGGEEPFAGWVRAAGYREQARAPHLVLFVPRRTGPAPRVAP